MEEALEIPIISDLTMVLGSISQVESCLINLICSSFMGCLYFP